MRSFAGSTVLETPGAAVFVSFAIISLLLLQSSALKEKQGPHGQEVTGMCISAICAFTLLQKEHVCILFFNFQETKRQH